MQFVYLISCQSHVKIGVANDVKSRIASLQTGNPYPLTLVACYGFENAEFVERALHQKFQKERGRGEWFLLSAEEITEFRQACQILGGDVFVPDNIFVSGEEVEEAEEIQDFVLDDPNVRIEKRMSNGEVRGFAVRSRDKDRKVINYVGKRANPEEFEKMMESFGNEK